MAFGGVIRVWVFASVFVSCLCATVLFDDFSSGHIDGSKWGHSISGDGQGNNEFQMYTPLPENSYVKNGNLYICPTLTSNHYGDNTVHTSFDLNAQFGHCDAGCQQSGYGKVPVIMSGKLNSKAHIKYGRVEVVAQLPKGDWLWPAIWMLPSEWHYGGWPASGEIDIMEARCNTNYFTKNEGWLCGVNQDLSTVHFGPAWDHKTSRGGQYTMQGQSLGDGFHTYWMDWNANHITLGIDSHTTIQLNTPANGYWAEGHFTGNNVWSSGGRDAPFDRPFYLILNVAVGGAFFNHGMVNHPYEQPWHDGWAHDAQMREFWEARHLWQPTWHGEEACMKVRSVKMDQA